MEARRRAYALLAELVSRGPAEETRQAALASPLLAAALERCSSLDEAAADHQHSFGFAVPPFEGAFVDPEARAGASAAVAIYETYRAMGFAPDTAGDDPEHLATELRALSWLSAWEAAALETGDREGWERARLGAARMLDGHLLRWVPVLASAVRRTGRAFPVALVDQVEGLLLAHRQELPPADASDEPFGLPPVRDLLGDPATSLRDVAEHLATPALSGLFVGRDDVTRIGRALGVPRGFGDRRVMLHNLLQGAVHQDRFAALVDALVSLVDDADAELASARLEREPMRRLLVPWRDRLATTRDMLERMRAAAPIGPHADADEHAPGPPGGERAHP